MDLSSAVSFPAATTDLDEFERQAFGEPVAGPLPSYASYEKPLPTRTALSIFDLPSGQRSTFAYWRDFVAGQKHDHVREKLKAVDSSLADAFDRVLGGVPRQTAAWAQLCTFFPEGALEAYTRAGLLRFQADELPSDLVQSFETVLPVELRGGLLREFCRDTKGSCDSRLCRSLRNLLTARDHIDDGTISTHHDLSGEGHIMARDIDSVDAPVPAAGLLGNLPAAARKGGEMGLAMVAQDIMQDAVRKLLVDGLGVDPNLLNVKSDLVRDLANVVGPALVNVGAINAPDSVPGTRFLAAASEAAFTGRVAHATYKHGTAVKNLVTLIAPQLNELRKVGAQLLGETLNPEDLQEIASEEKVVTKRKAAS